MNTRIDESTLLDVASQRIADLEARNDEITKEVAGWIDDFRTYFPEAQGLHDVFRGIEAMEAQIATFKTREKWMNTNVYYAEWFDTEGRTAHHQAVEDGYFDHEKHGEDYGFTELVNQVMRIEK
jgi:hypothetical protein